MTNTFFISDTHFGHANILNFKKYDGTPLRLFSSVEEMDEHMISQWNKTISDKDRVYFLGDFCMNRKFLPTFERLNGRICWILGNHDPWKLDDLLQNKKVDVLAGVKVFPANGVICSHIPIHPSSLMNDDGEGRWKLNIHGHLHANRVMKNGIEDERYFNVSVECLKDYTPVSYDEILKTRGLK